MAIFEHRRDQIHRKSYHLFEIYIRKIEMAPPKQSFRIPLPDGSSLSLSVFATRKDPAAEVISVQIRRIVDDKWVTDAKLAVYRSPEGIYSQLPDRQNR